MISLNVQSNNESLADVINVLPVNKSSMKPVPDKASSDEEPSVSTADVPPLNVSPVNESSTDEQLDDHDLASEHHSDSDEIVVVTKRIIDGEVVYDYGDYFDTVPPKHYAVIGNKT